MKNPHPRTKLTFLIVTVCLALAPAAFAVDPPPDGGYPNQNTAEGEDALFIGGHIGANTAIGYHALYSDDFGASNTAVGSNALYSTSGAYFNTGVGADALSSDTGAGYNTAVGYSALHGISGFAHSDNVAIGYRAMANADSFACVAVGSEALVANTGQLNTAIGVRSMENNTSGLNNTAVGWASMNHNTTGSNNAAVGLNSLAFITTGSSNSVMGAWAAVYNTSGSDLAVLGYQALYNNLTGNGNTAVGSNALFNNQEGGSNTAVGNLALSGNYSGSNNVALGASAGVNVTGGNNIEIGNPGVADESGVMRLGTEGAQTATYIAGIRTSPLAVATGIGITADGQLGVRASSARFKEAIKPMEKVSEAILALRPVTFRYKKQLDPKATPQFGLVAEEVAKVDPDLVARDAAGKPFTVRYDEVNAMLLNEFLKEHRKVEAQGAEIAELRAALKEQAEQLHKVSERLNSAALPPRLVENR
jgi:trimeric autotransporter adhesin